MPVLLKFYITLKSLISHKIVQLQSQQNDVGCFVNKLASVSLALELRSVHLSVVNSISLLHVRTKYR